MRRTACLVCALAILSMWAMTPGLADAGIGGMFLDVPTTHPAYSSVQELVQRGIIVMTAGGEFQGNAPLLRYDAAQWIARAVKNVEGTRVGTDVSPQVSALETRVSALDTTMARELQALRTELAQVRQQVAQGTGTDAAQKAQTAFILGVTGVVLAIAAVAIALLY